MTRHIKTLALDDVQPGMRLASDLLNPGGTLLLPRHTELNSQVINNLRKQGIATLQISSEPSAPCVSAARTPAHSDEADAALGAQHYQQQYDLIVNEVRHMFRGNNLDSVNHALQQTVLEHRLAQLPVRYPPQADRTLPAASQASAQPGSPQ